MKIPIKYEYGDAVYIMRKEYVELVLQEPDGTVTLTTNYGEYSDDDENLFAVWPDPDED